jgi:SHS2 domain-containing protein
METEQHEPAHRRADRAFRVTHDRPVGGRQRPVIDPEPWHDATCGSLTDPPYRKHVTRVQTMTYEFLPHTADLRLRIEAPSLEELFEDGARAMRELLVGSSPVSPVQHVRISLRADTPDELLLGLLREVLYRFSAEGEAPSHLVVSHASAVELEGALWVEALSAGRHLPQPEVKAVTRHGLEVRRSAERWMATVLLDL